MKFAIIYGAKSGISVGQQEDTNINCRRALYATLKPLSCYSVTTIKKGLDMFKRLIAASFLLVSLSGSSTVLAQGATQAIRGAAAGLEQSVEDNQKPLTAGPQDKTEKTAPGKIDQDAKREFKTTDSGLKYRILRKAEGRKPNAADKVEVHYKGWLDDLTVFDSSYRRGEPIAFGLNQVIKGWTEGVQLMAQGEMIELVIPSQLGYGPRGTPGGPIPPNAQLHFIVELISIK